MDSPVLAGFALSFSSGLNAFMPLLIAAIADRATDRFNFEQPYDFLSSNAGIAILLGLLTIELVADKIPRVDHLNDLIQSAIRPAAGAVLFMALVNNDDSLHPLVAMVLGLFIAGAVHWYKATSRPGITANTGGLGNPIASMVEDGLCAITSVLAVLVPAIGFIAAIGAFVALRATYHKAQTIDLSKSKLTPHTLHR